MVPRASHGVFDHQPFAEWPTIMRAGGTDREQLSAAASEQDGVFSDMPHQHRAVDKRLFRNAGLEVRVVRLARAAHVSPPGEDRDCSIDAKEIRMFHLDGATPRESWQRSLVKQLGVRACRDHWKSASIGSRNSR